MENKLRWCFCFLIVIFLSVPQKAQNTPKAQELDSLSLIFFSFFSFLTYLNNTDFNHVSTQCSDPFNTKASQHCTCIWFRKWHSVGAENWVRSPPKFASECVCECVDPQKSATPMRDVRYENIIPYAVPQNPLIQLQWFLQHTMQWHMGIYGIVYIKGALCCFIWRHFDQDGHIFIQWFYRYA